MGEFLQLADRRRTRVRSNHRDLAVDRRGPRRSGVAGVRLASDRMCCRANQFAGSRQGRLDCGHSAGTHPFGRRRAVDPDRGLAEPAVRGVGAVTRGPILCVVLAAIAGCGRVQDIDASQQIGPNPVLPKPAEELVAAVGVPEVVGWKAGEAPSVPPGFRIEAMATGLSNPRSLYPLANGDILVVETQRVGSEPLARPKDPVRDFIMSLAHGGGGAKETAGTGGGPPQRITLLRDSDGDGKPELKSVLLDHLNSPFGVALIGSDLYVANTDAIIRYPYGEGDTKITATGTTLTSLPGGPIDHH